MKLYKAIYQAVLILQIDEPCGTLHEAACNGDFFIQAETEAEAEEKALRIIENNFLTDYISVLNIEEVNIIFESSKECENCSFSSNGFCVLGFPCVGSYEEDYAAQDMKEGD